MRFPQSMAEGLLPPLVAFLPFRGWGVFVVSTWLLFRLRRITIRTLILKPLVATQTLRGQGFFVVFATHTMPYESRRQVRLRYNASTASIADHSVTHLCT